MSEPALNSDKCAPHSKFFPARYSSIRKLFRAWVAFGLIYILKKWNQFCFSFLSSSALFLNWMVILKTKRNCNRVMDLKKNIAHLLQNATECIIYSGRTRCCQRRLSPTRLSSFRAAAPDSERAWHSSSANSGPESSLLQGKIYFLRFV